MFKLYTYWRSSASYRVRIALHLKGLPFESVPVHLLRDGGEQHSAAYAELNPSELVPTLVDGAEALTQSLAIIEYLEEAYPTPALLPTANLARARVRALSQFIACEMHPLNNLRVLQYLERTLGLDEATKTAWYRHWVTTGFATLETMLANNPATGRFCHGDSPTMADCLLIPQISNARRFAAPLDAFPTVRRIETECMGLQAFLDARPEVQLDAA